MPGKQRDNPECEDSSTLSQSADWSADTGAEALPGFFAHDARLPR
jgi:hypothetical protein